MLVSLHKASGFPREMASGLHHVEFEVFGKVQRVFMRKYTVQAAAARNVSGYVFNTEDGSVKGEACGAPEAIESFKRWLETESSPKSRIEKAEFSPVSVVSDDPFDGKFIKKVILLSNGSQFAGPAPVRKKNTKKKTNSKKKQLKSSSSLSSRSVSRTKK